MNFTRRARNSLQLQALYGSQDASMTQVNRSADCGNSPKNKMAEAIAVALETRDIGFLATLLDSEVIWNYAGATVTTAEAILDHVGALDKPTSLTIDRVTSHGKAAAINGEARRGKSLQRFCHVIEFTSVKCNKIIRIESYNG